MPSKQLTDAQKEWYGGRHEGAPTPPRAVATPGGCPTPNCGQTTGYTRDLPESWVQVQVIGSTEPARLYCSGACAHFGIAIAELRVPVPATSEPVPEHQRTPDVGAPGRSRVTAYTTVAFPRGRIAHLTAYSDGRGGYVVTLCGKTSHTHSTTGLPTSPCSNCTRHAGQNGGHR